MNPDIRLDTVYIPMNEQCTSDMRTTWMTHLKRGLPRKLGNLRYLITDSKHKRQWWHRQKQVRAVWSAYKQATKHNMDIEQTHDTRNMWRNYIENKDFQNKPTTTLYDRYPTSKTKRHTNCYPEHTQRQHARHIFQQVMIRFYILLSSYGLLRR